MKAIMGGADSDKNGSCSLGCYDGGDQRQYDAREDHPDLMDALADLVSEPTPSASCLLSC